MPVNLNPEAMGVVAVNRPDRAINPVLKVNRSSPRTLPRGGGSVMYGYVPSLEIRS